jgi:hypothetical protein
MNSISSSDNSLSCSTLYWGVGSLFTGVLRIFNCSSFVRSFQSLYTILPSSSSNLILEGSSIPLELKTSLVKSTLLFSSC